MSSLRKFWQSLGPGLITGAADNDPAGLATYALAGARFGLLPLWVLLYILPFMIAIQSMCARIGALSGCGLAGNLRRHYSPWLILPVAGALVLANIFNLGANLYGMVAAINLILPVDIRILSVLAGLLVVFIVIKFRYRQIELIFKWLSLSLLVYGFTLVAIQPDWFSLIKHTLKPTLTFDPEFLSIIFALVGATLSPYLFFWQASQEAENLHQDLPRLKVCKFRPLPNSKLIGLDRETALGMIMSNIVSFFVMALAATTIFHLASSDAEIFTDLAQALEPLVGSYSFVFFVLGMVSSGLLVIPILAGSASYVTAEIMGWPASIDKPFGQARQFYYVLSGAIFLGMILPFLGIAPITALYNASIINGLVAPLCIILIIHMANNPAIVGDNRSTFLSQTLAFVALFGMLAGTVFIIIT